MAEREILDAETTTENRNTIANPLRSLKVSLEDGNAADEVKEALKTFNEVHEGLVAGEAGDVDPWVGYTGVQFGLGDEFDKTVDQIYWKYPTVTAQTASAIRQDVLSKLNNILPMLDQGAPQDEEMAGGRKKRRAKKTKSKTKKAKKTRRYTRRR